MIIFIHDQIKLDFSAVKFTFIKENHWFKDSLFEEYSLPSTAPITPELLMMIGDLDNNFLDDTQTVFDGNLYIDGIFKPATLEIQSISNKSVKLAVHFANFKLSTWETKLNQLSLQSFELTTVNIYDHALDIMDKTYPDVNYSFPTIWTDRFDTESDNFAAFLSRLNAYEDDDFVRNIDSPIENKNIMQPMPYLLHVLKQGFADAGKTLQGDILTDDDILKALIIAAVDYFNATGQDEIPLLLGYQDYDSFYQHTSSQYPYNNVTMANYIKEEDVPAVGRYRAIGSVKMIGSRYAPEEVVLKYGDDILFSFNKNEQELPPSSVDIDVTFEVTSIDIADGKTISIFVKDRLDGSLGEKVSVNVNPIRFHNDNGDVVSAIILPDEVNLKRTVPDMTFGELVKAVMNWKNFDLTISDDTVSMNYIRNKMQRDQAVDLSGFGPLFPEKRFNQMTSFEIMFTDGDKNPDYPVNKVFIDKTGYFVNNYEKKTDTKEIKINLLPLPMKAEGNVRTAYMLLDEETKLQLAFYNGLQNGMPNTLVQSSAIFPELYLNDWQYWINFRINAKTYLWDMYLNTEKSKDIALDKLIYNYGNFFVIKKLESTREDGNNNLMKLEADKLL